MDSKCASCLSKISFFPENDDGVPPFCRNKNCPLDHRHWLNHWWVTEKLGRVGLAYFDQHRKVYFGFASLATILAMVITTYGCFALSTDPLIVQRTYWAGGTVHNSTSGRDFTLYIGLRSVVYVDCLFQPGYEKYNGNCDPQSIEWSSDQCKSSSVVGLACDACSSAAISLWLTSVASVVGLVLALLGAQTRMRVASDIPIQKLLGAIADTCGALSLIFTLLLFHTNCVYPLHNAFNVAHLNPVFWSGPGVYAYSICAVSGGIRAVVHWLTPLPGVIPMCGPKSAYQRAPISATSFRSEKPTVVWSESTNPIQSSFRAESLLTESSFQIEMTSNVKSDFKTDLKSDVKSGDRKGHHREVPTDEDGYDYQNIL